MPRSSSAVAVAAVVLTFYPYSKDVLCKSASTPIGFGVLPVEREGPGMFRTEPSLASLASWVTSVLKPSSMLPINSPYEAKMNPIPSRSLRAAPEILLSPHTLPPIPIPVPASVPTVLFVPLSVTSLVTKASTVGMKADKEKRRLRKCCEESNTAGIAFYVRHTEILELIQTADSTSYSPTH